MKNILLATVIVVITIAGSLFIINKNKPVANADDIVEKMESIYDGYADNYNVIEDQGSVEVVIGGLDRPEETTYSDELDRSTAINLAKDFSKILGTHYAIEKRNNVTDKELFTIRADHLTVKIHFKQ